MRRRALLTAPLAAPFVMAAADPVAALLAERIDMDRMGVGLVAGLLEPAGTRLWRHGSTGAGSTPDIDTLFEIGSVTKVFTALLLADMVGRGELAWNDPVALLLPGGVGMPSRDGRQVTLLDLATYSSGLPRLPTNFQPRDPARPYADYDAARLYAFLSAYLLPYPPGQHYDYANLGFGLLGHVLARRADTDYETLVRQRICRPLGLDSTTIGLTPAQSPRMAQGHDATLAPAPNWPFDVLAGAGALRSSGRDMLRFLGAALGRDAGKLGPAFAALLATRRPSDFPATEVGCGWFVSARQGGELVWKDGGTGGFRSYVGLLPGSGRAAMVLSNAATWLGVNDIGLHLLDPASPPAVLPRAVAADPAALAGAVGRYRLTPAAVLSVEARGLRLFAQLSGQPAYEVFPLGGGAFFYRVVDARLRFEPGPDGRALRVVLRQNGRDLVAARMP